MSQGGIAFRIPVSDHLQDATAGGARATLCITHPKATDGKS